MYFISLLAELGEESLDEAFLPHFQNVHPCAGRRTGFPRRVLFYAETSSPSLQSGAANLDFGEPPYKAEGAEQLSADGQVQVHYMKKQKKGPLRKLKLAQLVWPSG